MEEAKPITTKKPGQSFLKNPCQDRLSQGLATLGLGVVASDQRRQAVGPVAGRHLLVGLERHGSKQTLLGRQLLGGTELAQPPP